jgi:hypothetical protein
MIEKFYFENNSGLKLLIIGENSPGKTIFLNLLKGIGRFRNLRMHDDFWFLDNEEKKRALINNHILTSKRFDDFNIVKNELYLVIDLNRFLNKSDTLQQRRNILTELATKIEYGFDKSSNKQLKKCTCDVYHLLRTHGCKCGAVVPYKGKTILW